MSMSKVEGRCVSIEVLDFGGENLKVRGVGLKAARVKRSSDLFAEALLSSDGQLTR